MAGLARTLFEALVSIALVLILLWLATMHPAATHVGARADASGTIACPDRAVHDLASVSRGRQAWISRC